MLSTENDLKSHANDYCKIESFSDILVCSSYLSSLIFQAKFMVMVLGACMCLRDVAMLQSTLEKSITSNQVVVV